MIFNVIIDMTYTYAHIQMQLSYIVKLIMTLSRANRIATCYIYVYVLLACNHPCNPYPEPVVFQWLSSGNPVCLELRPQCTLECHWRNASVLPVVFQWSSSGFPVVFQCVPIMQINTGSPLEHHWALASASVVPVAFQCTCGSSGLPVCSNYAN